jgi:Tfp pilus assembly protein PilW
MTKALRIVLLSAPFAFASAAFAADPPSSDQAAAPETVKVASAESVAAGDADHRFAYMLVKSESGQCYAIAPPGGEGMTAGDRYMVVAATDVSEATRAEMTKGHAHCKVVNVVARVAK